ncbi:MAG TPA: motility-associated protein, partial [Chloroflexota bacterium]|nr:motility-associated protein [Chloroflexota bacterium]
MNLTTIIGLVVGFGSLMVSLVMEGGDLLSFLKPSAALIVFGGTFGATFISFPGSLIARFPKIVMRAFFNKSVRVSELSDVLV